MSPCDVIACTGHIGIYFDDIITVGLRKTLRCVIDGCTMTTSNTPVTLRDQCCSLANSSLAHEPCISSSRLSLCAELWDRM